MWKARNFKRILSGLKQEGYAGLKYHIPLKNLAYEICHELSSKADYTESVNTISIRNQ